MPCVARFAETETANEHVLGLPTLFPPITSDLDLPIAVAYTIPCGNLASQAQQYIAHALKLPAAVAAAAAPPAPGAPAPGAPAPAAQAAETEARGAWKRAAEARRWAAQDAPNVSGPFFFSIFLFWPSSTLNHTL